MTTPRATPTVVLTASSAPAIVNGKPVVPAYWAHNDSHTKLGLTHFRAIRNPDTYSDGSGYVNPPAPSDKWHSRWTVNTLPNPANYGGFYWLGAPTGADGSSSYNNSGTHSWLPSGDSKAGTPIWHSIFPFKPSVTAVDHYLQGGGVIHHPRGVNFNSHFIEHMWLDWGRAKRPPFTWVIAAAVASWPSSHYTHYLLDAGRSPDAAGFPRLSANDTGTPRTINDNLEYRNMLAIKHTQIVASARHAEVGPGTIRARTNAALRPRMYVMIANGTSSYTGAWSPGVHRLQKGVLDNLSTQPEPHRYYVMGRAFGHMSQAKASHLLVFEMRYFNSALDGAQLDAQYAQLSSVWHFDRYRTVGG